MGGRDGLSGYKPKFGRMASVNNPVRHAADAIIMDWIDTKDARPDESRLYAFVNDNAREVSTAVLDALSSYEITPVLWSHRSEARHTLAAWRVE
jgi:hypothetical protein